MRAWCKKGLWGSDRAVWSECASRFDEARTGRLRSTESAGIGMGIGRQARNVACWGLHDVDYSVSSGPSLVLSGCPATPPYRCYLSPDSHLKLSNDLASTSIDSG